MVSRTLLRKLFRDLWARKASLSALVAIVGVGVGVFVSMAAVFHDLDGARERYYTRCRLADFSVSLKRAPDRTLRMIEELENVRAVRGRVKMDALIFLNGIVRPIQGSALSMPAVRRPVIDDVILYSGSWFSDGDAEEVIVERQFAEAHGLQPGDRIKVLLRDKQHDLLVTGTAMSPEFVYLIPPGGGLAPDPDRYGVLYLPGRFLRKASDLEGAYNELVGTAADDSRVALEDTLDLIDDKLDAYGVTYAGQVRDRSSIVVLRDELTNLRLTAYMFPVIFLGLAAMVLKIMIGRLVAQQRVVIGTLRALGYSRGSVTIHYLGYGIFAGGLGGVVGTLFGLWFQGVMDEIYKGVFTLPGIEPHFQPGLIVAGLLVALFFGTIGALGSSRRAASLEPAEAMRPPPPEQGGRVLVEGIGFLWDRLSFQWKMIFRSVFRNPFRSIVSLTTAAIATALLIATAGLSDGIDYMMRYHFEKIEHEDYTVSLRDPKGIRAIGEAEGLATVARAEPQLVIPCDLTNGPHKKRTAVTGLPREPRLYTPLDSSGEPVIVPTKGLILTRSLATILHVEEGDSILLRPLIARREETRAPVMKVIDSFLGLAAYCDIRYLSGLLGENRVENQILLSTFAGTSPNPLMAELRTRPSVIGVSGRRSSLRKMRETMGEFMTGFVVVMIVFSGIVAFGGILNTALVSLSEREREVGTLRVLGYTAGQTARIFTGESFLLNAVGIALGIGLGVALTHLLAMAYDTEMYRIPVIIDPSRPAATVLLMLFFVGASQLTIYFMIRGLAWLEVLKVKE
jgi:putative ABC transport system permease protein